MLQCMLQCVGSAYSMYLSTYLVRCLVQYHLGNLRLRRGYIVEFREIQIQI